MFVRRRPGDEAADPEPAELAALADESLAPAQRAALEARVAESPELAALLAEQELAVELIRAAGAAVTVPATLRANLTVERRGSHLRRLARAFARRPRS